MNMPKKIMLLILVLLCCWLYPQAEAAVNIRLGYIKADTAVLDPIILQQYYTNYLDELSKQTDWNYQLVPVNVSDCFERLQSGDIDLLLSVEYPASSARSSLLHYSSVNLGYDIECLYTNPAEERFNANDLNTLNGARVGLIANRLANEKLTTFQQDNELQFSLHYYPDQQTMLQALADGTVDLIVDTATNMLSDRKFLLAYAKIPVRVAGTDNSAMHLSELEAALHRLRLENPGFESGLNLAFNQHIDYKLIHYTPAESRFIRTIPPLRIAIYNSDYPYIEFDDTTGEPNGIYADLLAQISEKAGLQFQFVHAHSYEEASQMIQDDQADIMIDIFTDDPDNQSFYFTNPIFNAPYTLISAYQDQPTDNDIDVALPCVSPSLLTYLQQEFPKWKLRPTSSNIQNSLDLVSNKQADMALIDNINLDMDRPLILYPDLAIIPGLSIKVPVSLAISTRQPRILQSILNKAIIQLDPQITAQIIQKHTINQQPKLTLQHLLTFYPVQLGLGCGLILLIFSVGVFMSHHSRQMKKHQTLLSTQNEILQATIDELQKTSTSRDNYRAMAETDALTGVLNKAAIEYTGNAILKEVPDEGCCHALLIIDLDHFKEANDTFGHQYGDDILRRFAQALTHAVRHHDAVGRFGGDEFVLVLNNLPPQTVAYIARRINATAQDLDVDADGHTRLSASIGAAFYPEHGTDYQELLYKADRALYKVKKSGRNSWASAT